MKITEIIAKLEAMKEEMGDVEVVVTSDEVIATTTVDLANLEDAVISASV